MAWRFIRTSAVAVAVVLASGAVSAHHRAVIVNGQRVQADASQKCECRAFGKAFTVDEEICLNGRMATCSMDQNVTSWRQDGRMCPQS